MIHMGYLDGMLNLYKPEAQAILREQECYALEKVHGTSARVELREGRVHYAPGGVSLASFQAAFPDPARLEAGLRSLGQEPVRIYGEAYGGKCQGMSRVYGAQLRFIAFEVKILDTWLDVPAAEQIATMLGLEFVPYVRIPATLEALDAERARPSEVARRRGMGEHQREGIVIRPLTEKEDASGHRMIAKHKHPKYGERASDPAVTADPTKLQVLAEAAKIADEWVTEMRLHHVLDALVTQHGRVLRFPEDLSLVLSAMVQDVYREAGSEIVQSPAAARAIRQRTVALSQLPKTYIPGAPAALAALRRAKMGALAGQGVVPDDFDAPLPPEEQRLWEGEEDPS